jgi:hypothetical protein
MNIHFIDIAINPYLLQVALGVICAPVLAAIWLVRKARR